MTGLAPELETLLRRHHADVVAALPEDTIWFDAHTHIGSNDPDGFKATAAEILGSLRRRGPAAAAWCSPCTSPTATRPPTTT